MKRIPLILLLSAHFALASEPVILFDGKTLGGWDCNPEVWRVEDGVITGGSLTQNAPRNEFIASKKHYQNFELKLKIKCEGDPATGFINSGIQIRSRRIPEHHEMIGYQVDVGDGFFGKIYDESRRKKMIADPVDAKALTKVVDVFGWNEFVIRAEGPQIQVWINGTKATDFTETDLSIPLDGAIAPQVHSGGKTRVQIKDISIQELPATPDAPNWKDAEKQGR